MRPARVIAGVALAAAFLGSYARLWLGIDFTDESLYVSLPDAFLRGHLPFRDELMPLTAPIVTTPLAWAFETVTGGKEGIVLFFRHMYFVASALCAGLAFLTFRRLVDTVTAVLLAAVFLAYLPFLIPNLSYDTQPSFAFFAGSLCVLHAAWGERAGPWYLAACVLQAVAAFSYPTLFPACALSLATGLWLVRSRGNAGDFRRATLALALVGVVSIAVVAVCWKLLGPERLAETMKYMGSLNAHEFSLGKLRQLLRLRAIRIPASMVMMALTALGPLAYFRLPPGEREPFRLVAIALYLPACVAGVIFGWTSSNGVMVSAIGLQAAALSTLAVASRLGARRPIAVALGMTLVVAALVASQYGWIYRDDPTPRLTTRMTEGPFRGLYTTPAKAAFLSQVARDVAAASAGARTILFFDGFPAGYLMTPLLPLTRAIWVVNFAHYTSVDRSLYTRYYEKRGELPDVVVEMKRLPLATDDLENAVPEGADGLREFFRRAGYREFIRRDKYVVWNKP